MYELIHKLKASSKCHNNSQDSLAGDPSRERIAEAKAEHQIQSRNIGFDLRSKEERFLRPEPIILSSEDDDKHHASSIQVEEVSVSSKVAGGVKTEHPDNLFDVQVTQKLQNACSVGSKAIPNETKKMEECCSNHSLNMAQIENNFNQFADTLGDEQLLFRLNPHICHSEELQKLVQIGRSMKQKQWQPKQYQQLARIPEQVQPTQEAEQEEPFDQKLPSTHKHSYSVEPRRIRTPVKQFKHRKVASQVEQLATQFRRCIKIIRSRNNPEGDTEYYWKIGTVKRWMTLQQAIEQAFTAYYHHFNQYRSTVFKFLPEQSAIFTRSAARQRVQKVQYNAKLGAKRQQTQQGIDKNSRKNLRDPLYRDELKQLFNEVLVRKFMHYEHNNSDKNMLKVEEIVDLEFSSLGDSQNQTEFLPTTNQLNGIIYEAIQQSPSSTRMNASVEYQNTVKHQSTETKREAKQFSQCRKNVKPRTKKTMSPKLIKALKQCHYEVDYVTGVDKIVGTLAKEQPKLSCSQGLGLRSSQKPLQITKEDYLKSVKDCSSKLNPSPHLHTMDIIELDSQ